MWYVKGMMKRKIVPREFVRQLPDAVGETYRLWADYMYEHVPFNMPDSVIHSTAHSERVLLYALLMGHRLLPGDAYALEVLGHASIFHDTRREDDGTDRGHGGRAADFYETFCSEHGGLSYHPESACLMRYHDLDDTFGKEAIAALFAEQAEWVLLLYQIFKDADALDRYRLSPRGPHPKYLRTDAAFDLLGFAQLLVARTHFPYRRRY